MALAIFRSKDKENYPTNKSEIRLNQVDFIVHKINNRPRPTKRERIKIVSCFSEFGCETLGCMYCIPRLLKRFPGQYVIAMGWHGREYLYRHLVDEYWELKEEYMWLRDYSRAFHHISWNLKKIEEAATLHGDVIPSSALGKYAVMNICRTCGKFWHEWKEQAERCPVCKSTVLIRSVFTDIATYKPQARRIPKPCQELFDWAGNYLSGIQNKKGIVGIFARNRKTYGRNLPADFYVKLIQLLEESGYGVIWLGEKQNTLPCPVNHVIDFSRSDEARDLEKTLAIICHLKFTIQFWTASSRLSGMMGTPFIIFESPEQIYASFSGLMAAQEGKRLELTSFGPKKVVLSHFHSVLENQDAAIDLVSKAINEMNAENWNDILGLVEDPDFSTGLKNEYYNMLK